MRFNRIQIAALAVMFVIVCIIPANAAEPVGGNQGWISIHCNMDGAQVFFDGSYQGQITGGVLNVGVYSTGTPYKSYSVSKDGYSTYTASIPYMPGIGETENLYATLNPVVPTTQAIIGGNQGWYTVSCNVNGATVMFDNQVVGTITQGTLTVPVYTTGTPYQTYTVSMNGYLPYTAPMPGVPGAGQTITLYATLNPAPTTVPVPAPTKSSLPVWISLIGIGIIAVFATRNPKN
jgi:hypothetical protein